MATVNFSNKLSNYLAKIKSQTGREIKLEFTTDLGPTRVRFGFKHHPSHIIIIVRKGTDISTPDSERSIAHEVTHGFLLYKLGYHRIDPRHPLSASRAQQITLINTMIDDMVANKTIQQEGFAPYSSRYVEALKKEINAARQRNIDLWIQIPGDTLLRDRNMVFRYIQAWGFNKYFDLEKPIKRLIRDFLKSFKRSFPRQFMMAREITKVVSKNDIFTVEGHRQILQTVLELWQLEDDVELRQETSN